LFFLNLLSFKDAVFLVAAGFILRNLNSKV